MQNSDALKSLLTGVERQIGDKQQQIQIDREAAQREQQRLQKDIADAMMRLTKPETDPGQHQSWQREADELQSRLNEETQKMQAAQQTHQTELDTLYARKTELQREIQEALESEQAERIARMAI